MAEALASLLRLVAMCLLPCPSQLQAPREGVGAPQPDVRAPDRHAILLGSPWASGTECQGQPIALWSQHRIGSATGMAADGAMHTGERVALMWPLCVCGGRCQAPYRNSSRASSSLTQDVLGNALALREN